MNLIINWFLEGIENSILAVKHWNVQTRFCKKALWNHWKIRKIWHFLHFPYSSFPSKFDLYNLSGFAHSYSGKVDAKPHFLSKRKNIGGEWQFEFLFHFTSCICMKIERIFYKKSCGVKNRNLKRDFVSVALAISNSKLKFLCKTFEIRLKLKS